MWESSIYESDTDWGFSCGLLTEGGVDCWGEDRRYSDLKNTLFDPEFTPEGEFTQVGAGKEDFCGLRPSGVIECWGAGPGFAPEGGLIVDSFDGDGEGYTALSVGREFACGLRHDGAADCWAPGGESSYQREGHYVAVSAGYAHQCGVLRSGDVECWAGGGSEGSSSGEVVFFAARPCRLVEGCSSRVDSLDVSGGPLGGFVSVSAGLGYSCGLRGDGGVECWEWGGDSLPEQWWELQWVSWSSGAGAAAPAGVFTAVSAGWGNACGLRPGGELECWGPNRSEVVSPPAGVFKEVSVGLEHACATLLDDSVTCWGSSGWRQPSILPPGGVFTDFTLGYNFACEIRESASVECWGQGFSSPLPPRHRRPPSERSEDDGITRYDRGWEPPQVPSGAFADIRSWPEGACGLRPSGAVECWSYVDYRGEGFWSPDGEFASISPIWFAADWVFCGERAEGGGECWKIWGEKLPPPYPHLPWEDARFW